MAVLFWIVWICLSGEVSWATVLTGGAVAAALEVFCRKYLGYRGRHGLGAARRLWAMARYAGRLVAEMLRAGFVVMRLIYTKGRSLEPVLVRFDSALTSDAARSVLANSITLTAGTITVDAGEGTFLVHALDRTLAEGIEKSEFSRRLEKMEAQP